MTTRKVPVIPALTAAVCIALVVSCGKKAAQSSPADVAAPVTAEQPAAVAPISPPTASAVPPPNQSVQNAQAALAAKNYDQLATLLINYEKTSQSLPPEQAGPATFQMLQLKQSLSSAAAAGDPNAAAAMQKVIAARRAGR